MSVFRPGTRPSGLRARAAHGLLAAVAVALLAAGCDDGTLPDEAPFGRTGLVRITVQAPVEVQGAFDGRRDQTVTWGSDGRWQLVEGIYYKGQLGDASLRRSTEDPQTLAQRYATWIAGVSDSASAYRLFLADLPASRIPNCGGVRSAVTVQIVDTQRADSIGWTRCGDGTLETLSAEHAGPAELGPASRVVEAARLVRNFTVNAKGDYAAAYGRSRPFRTIVRGEQGKPGGPPLVVPRIIEDAAAWSSFWTEFISASSPVPTVDFASEVVLIGAVGMRQEVGDSVEVREVLPVAFGTQVNLTEQRLGDFCTPAPRPHAPFHVVAAPLVPKPIYFAVADKVEHVQCG